MRQVCGFKFRRQVPIGPNVADFCCLDAKLIVELDGGQHQDQHIYDKTRDAWLKQHGFRVLRFWNNQVMNELDAVVEVIAAHLRPHPSLPPQAGEGANASPPPLAGEG